MQAEEDDDDDLFADNPFADAAPSGSAEALDGSRLRRVLTLARQLCAPLAFLHGEGIVHRDLKPDNIIVRADGTPVLVDFGVMAEFGAAVGRDRVTADSQVAGTPFYMAPEQITGADMDARADLYALGCVLYELLTGEPPFTGDSAARVLRAHLEREPAPPSSCADGIPPAVDELVLRLLAKEPAKRLGYAVDVAAALVDLGAEDAAGEPGPRPRIYLYRPGLAGRDAVLEELRAGLSPLLQGRGGLTFVGGESGVGKSRLVLELVRAASERGAQVLAGEAQALAGRPLGALCKPLQAIADRCLERGAQETDRLLGPRGPLLARHEPTLADLPGQDRYPAPPELPPDAARQRLFRSLHETLAALAADRPVLLVLDDLQWADELTLGFIGALASGDALARQPLHLLGTYRTEEVGPGLARLLREPGCRLVPLERLDRLGVGAIVADMLALASPPAELVRFVARRSEGNPFFIGEYLRAAAQEALLRRDRQGRWHLAHQHGADGGFDALDLPETLRDLIVLRLGALTRPARRLAELAAAAGREVPLALLEQVSGLEPAALQQGFAELLERQVAEEPVPGTLRFAHDKLRETTYDAMDAERKRALHQRLAEALDTPGGRQDQSHAIAMHYTLGEVHRDPARVLEANLHAGEVALGKEAPHEALTLFQQADRVAREHNLRPGPRLASAWGEACARTHRVQEAARHLAHALEQTDRPAARASLRARLAMAHLASWDSASAWQECRRALDELGHPLSESRARQLLASGRDWLRGLWIERRAAAEVPPVDEERARLQALAEVYQTGMVAAYFELDAINFVQLIFRALLPANRLGPSPELVDARAKYAVALGVAGLDAMADGYSERAVAMADDLGDIRLRSAARLWRAVTKSFSGRAAQGVAEVSAVLQDHGRWLDTADYINACADLTWDYMIRGFAREAWQVQELLIKKTSEVVGPEASMEGHPALSQQLVVLSMLGRHEQARPYLELARRLMRQNPRDRFRAAYVNCNALMYHLERGELGQPVEDAIRAYRQVSPGPLLTIYHLKWFYVFQGYVRLTQAERAEGAALAPALALLGGALGQLRRAANVGVLRSHWHAIAAGEARLRGRRARAEGHCRRAAALARDLDSPWVEYEVARLRGALSRDAGDHLAADARFHEALALCRAHGWAGRQQALQGMVDPPAKL